MYIAILHKAPRLRSLTRFARQVCPENPWLSRSTTDVRIWQLLPSQTAMGIFLRLSLSATLANHVTRLTLDQGRDVGVVGPDGRSPSQWPGTARSSPPPVTDGLRRYPSYTPVYRHSDQAALERRIERSDRRWRSRSFLYAARLDKQAAIDGLV